MKSMALLLAALLLTACGQSAAPDDLTGTPVVLKAETYFVTPDGEAVVLPPGPVTVAAEGGVLRVQAPGGPIRELAAADLDHEVAVPGPSALVVPREETGATHLVLLLPGGRGFDALGSPDGAKARGGAALEPWEAQFAYSEAVAGELLEIAGSVPDRDRDELREILSEQDERLGAMSEDGGSQYGVGEISTFRSVDGVRKLVSRARARIDEPRIYLGDPDRFGRPATVDLDKVYAKIPEYREILDRDLDRRDASYTFLLSKASRKFLAAIQRVSEKDGYDLIGGRNAIRIPGEEVPDITSAVIPFVKE